MPKLTKAEADKLEADAKLTLDLALADVEFGRAAMESLRRPFTAAAIKWKTQVGKEGDSRFLMVSYIDARLALERMNLVVPHLWSDSYSEPATRGGKAVEVVCKIDVGKLARCDVGSISTVEFEKNPAMHVKTLRSDAFKRACVKFGIGVSLYAMEPAWLDASQMKTTKSGKLLGPNPGGLKHLNDQYSLWLHEHAAKYFGPPLDHGDQLGAQGDVDADPDATSQHEPEG